MDTFVLLASLMKFGYAILAVFALITLLKWMDRTNGVRFGRDILSVIRNDPTATAHYFGARLIGVCILVGLVIA